MQSWSNELQSTESTVDEQVPITLWGVTDAACNIVDCTPDYSCMPSSQGEIGNFEKLPTKLYNSDISYDYDKEDSKCINEFSDPDVDNDSGEEQQSLLTGMSNIVIEDNMEFSTVDKILKLFHPYHPNLPLTARTLLSTGKHSFSVKKVDGGEYVHFGIEFNLLKLHGELSQVNSDILKLQINIDGLPLFRSSPMQLWPILGRVVGTASPFLIGAFCGQSKPSNVDSYLQDFINEAVYLHDQGLVLNGVRFRVQVTCFICDAPARSFLKQTKSHTGYFGCERCTQKGVYLDNRMTFPLLDSTKRTDEQFAKHEYQQHQTNRSPLLLLNIGLVSCFVLDYMHLMCLGVVRRILFTWIKGPLKVRLSARHIGVISQKLLALRGYIPDEFSRKPRALAELEHWKATELRQFVLYTGPVVLKGHMKSKHYKHFICLSVIMHLMLSPSLCMYYCDYAEKLIACWLSQSKKLYGKQFIVYNVHSLLHLPDDVRKYGHLDAVSAFPFENFMRHLKSTIRKPQKVLEQLANRMAEGSFHVRRTTAKEYGVKKEHFAGPVVAGLVNHKQYRELYTKDYILTCSTGDNAIAFDNSIALVLNICDNGTEVSLIVQQFKHKKQFFGQPMPSSDLGIYKLWKLNKNFDICKLSQVRSKYVLLPWSGDKWIGMPLVHSNC